MRKVFDVIVLGLGAMGSASLYQLAKKGKRVLGIDQFAPPHTWGSSHGESRVIRQAIGEGDEYVPLVLRSYELWREIEAAAGNKLLETTGGLIMASAASGVPIHGSRDFLEQTIAAAKKFGIEHLCLDTAEIRSRFPQFNLAGDEQGYYEPAMGFLRPELCISSQLALAGQERAEIRTNERVLEVKPEAGEVRIKTSMGEYASEQVVMAAGSWINRLPGEKLSQHFKIYRQTLFWFEPKEPLESYRPGRFPVFIWGLGRHLDDLVYGFPAIRGPGGGIKVASEQHVSETDPDTVERTVKDEEIGAMYRSYIRDRLPGLSDRCLRTAVCLYTSTADSGFVIDYHPAHPAILVVSPCSGHGFKHSAAIGEIVSELLTVGQSRIDIRKFKLNRFRRPSI